MVTTQYRWKENSILAVLHAATFLQYKLLMYPCIRYADIGLSTKADELMVVAAIITPSLVMITLGVVAILGLISFCMKNKLKIDKTKALNMERSTLPRYFHSMCVERLTQGFSLYDLVN